MSLTNSSLPVSEQVRKARHAFADKLEKQLAADKPWYDFPDPADYRKARRDGTHGFNKPIRNERARLVNIAARDGHEIELRIISPESKPAKGVWLHFHAGGFVIGSNASYDTYLTKLSEALGLTIVSVEYRLAPEHPYPTCRNDAVDAALYALSPAGIVELGAPLKVLGGESAGGWFAVAVALALRDEHGVDVRSQLAAICAGYGIFDLTYTPSVLSHERAIVLSRKDTFAFMEAAFGHIPMADRKTAQVSPLYANLANLPPAHFLVGTIEPLLDDSIFMAAKWQQAGNETVLDIVEGGCHAFTLIPMGDTTDEGLQRIIAFVQRYLK